MKILGLDLSLRQPAHAIIEVKKGKPKLIDHGHIKTSPNWEPSRRLQRIKNYLEHIYLTQDFDHVARESVPTRVINPKTVDQLCQVAGMAVLVFKGVEIKRITPTTVKKVVTGNARAKKPEVDRGVREIMKLPDDYLFGTSASAGDEQDACGVALSLAVELGEIDPAPKKTRKV